MFAVGDSKTAGDTWVTLLAASLTSATGAQWVERPNRFGIGGYTWADMDAYLTANLAGVIGTATRIVINLGVNDAVSLPAEATWKANAASVISQLHTKWPNAHIYIAQVWSRFHTADIVTLDGWIADEVALNPSFCHLGPDERIWLENGDDGNTYTSDGTHYNDPAEPVCAARWMTAFGL